MRDALREAICTAGWLGRVPGAPGTAGTLGGVGVFLLLAAAGAAHPAAVLGAAAIAGGAGVLLTPWARRRFGRIDPPEVVIDEVAGYLVSVALILRRGVLPLPAVAGLGFLLFRFFDIVKPPPVSWVDRSESRLALVGDDLVAGLYANLCLHVAAAVMGDVRG